MKRDLHLEVRAERMYTIMFISCSPFVACPYCPSTTRSWDVAWRARAVVVDVVAFLGTR